MIFVPSNTWTRYNLHSFLCSSTSCSILCVKTLINILQHHSLYKDVFREVGILEVMVTCLNRYAALFRDSQSEETIQQGEGYILEVWSLVSIDTPHCSGILNQRRPISKVSFIFWRSWSRVSIGTPHCSGILNQKKPLHCLESFTSSSRWIAENTSLLGILYLFVAVNSGKYFTAWNILTLRRGG